MPDKQRFTSYKIWIRHLTNGNFFKKEADWDSSYVLVNNEKVARVNIIANVIAKFKNDDGSYSSLIIDDGSDTIRIKTWREDTNKLENIKIGDMINIIGRVRMYNNEVYVTPEIIKQLDDPNWELVRKLELIKKYGSIKEDIGKPKIAEEFVEDNVEITENLRQKILVLVERLDKENGASKDDVILKSNVKKEDAEFVINELIKEGEIYENKTEKLKLTG